MINYNHLIDNINYVKNYTNKELMIIVKNNAYNIGLENTVKHCIENGYRYFGVATIEEALQVNSVSNEIFVLILNPLKKHEIEEAKKYNFTISIPSYEWYQQHHEYLGNLNLHIKLNVGMNRFGFSDMNLVNELLNTNKNITGLYTHFPVADEDDLSIHNSQVDKFVSMFEKVENKQQLELIHSENSPTLLYKDERLSFCNIVRSGLISYGYTPSYPIPELKATIYISKNIFYICDVKAGQYVGYGLDNYFDYDTRIAVCPIGYGDGIARDRKCLPVYIDNKPFKVVAISMSHMLIEVDDTIKVDDEVEIFGDNAKIDLMIGKSEISPAEQMTMLQMWRLK
ncbi:MAG: alanine racemase [Erysipelotrichales bacterium]